MSLRCVFKLPDEGQFGNLPSYSTLSSMQLQREGCMPVFGSEFWLARLA